jgi:hypothetical protein
MARLVTLTRDHPRVTIDGHPAYRLTIRDANTGQRISDVLEVMLPNSTIEYRSLVNQRIGPSVASVVRSTRR